MKKFNFVLQFSSRYVFYNLYEKVLRFSHEELLQYAILLLKISADLALKIFISQKKKATLLPNRKRRKGEGVRSKGWKGEGVKSGRVKE